jgi:alkyl hydroperoxide reductase subunit AhpF
MYITYSAVAENVICHLRKIEACKIFSFNTEDGCQKASCTHVVQLLNFSMKINIRVPHLLAFIDRTQLIAIN